jgi:IclR family pca regulon transcriptional regulator
MNKQDTLFVGSLEKGLRVLDAFRRHPESLGITEIARATGLDKSAAQRFTTTLHRLGYLEKDPQTRRYSPALRLMDFSYAYLRHDRLAEIAVARLIEASKAFGSTANLCRLEGTDIIYTVRIPHENATYPATVPGRRMPAFCTSGGMAILAHRPAADAETVIAGAERHALTEHTITEPDGIRERIAQVRELGYAIGISQSWPNEISIAAPVVDDQGLGIAAVQFPVYMPRWTAEEAVDKIAPLAMDTARAISGSLHRGS